MRKVLSAVATAAVLMVPAAQAQTAPTPTPDKLSVSPATLEPGGKMDVSGGGCPGGTEVALFPGARDFAVARQIVSIPTMEDGSFHGTARIPDSMGLGSHTISAVCADRLVGSASVRLAVKGFAGTGGAPQTLTVSRSAVAPGRTVKVFGRRCPTGEVGAALNDTRVALAAPGRLGAAFKADLTIPKGTQPGKYTLSTRCNGLAAGAATLRVISADRSLPARVDGPPAQRTSLLVGTAASFLLVVAGAIALMYVKRHRTRTVTPGYFDLPSSQRPAR